MNKFRKVNSENSSGLVDDSGAHSLNNQLLNSRRLTHWNAGGTTQKEINEEKRSRMEKRDEGKGLCAAQNGMEPKIRFEVLEFQVSENTTGNQSTTSIFVGVPLGIRTFEA